MKKMFSLSKTSFSEFTWENYNRHMRRVCPGHYEDISDDELDQNDRSNDIPPGDDDLYTFPGKKVLKKLD